MPHLEKPRGHFDGYTACLITYHKTKSVPIRPNVSFRSSDVPVQWNRWGAGQIGGTEYINTDLTANPPQPERNDPTSVLRMRHQRSLLLAGTSVDFVALLRAV